jgi:formylglycine-generating enzyme required for sulfatase activity
MREALWWLPLVSACTQTLYVEGLGVSPDGGRPPLPPEMVELTDLAGDSFWIDRYEASLVLGRGVVGDEDQDQDDDGKIADPEVAAAHASSHGWVADDDETGVVLTTVVAESARGEIPAELSYYQAAGACVRAGKRLCRATEWRAACQNQAQATRYPYGQRFDQADQAGADCWTRPLRTVQGTGTATACQRGGGLRPRGTEEWVDYEDPGHAVARGGTSERRLTCGSANTNAPSARYQRTGFRCCRDP